MLRTIVGLQSLLLAACVSQPTVSPLKETVSPLRLVNQRLFDGQRPVIDEPEIFQLSVRQQEDFLSHLRRAEIQALPPHKQVYDYVEKFVHRFDYLGETHTASQALHLTEGNCLSLAIVTTALARLANVPIGYQLVDSLPVFERKDGFVLRGRHVRTLLHHREVDRSMGQVAFSASTLIVDYFPDKSNRLVRSISEAEYIAMYYRNLAADALLENDLTTSFTLVKASLQHAPNDADAINLLALLHRRAGDDVSAESLFQFGIDHAENRLTLLNNYRNFLRTHKRHDEVATITRRLAKYDDQHPYRWLGLAHTVYRNGDFSEALQHYRRAARLAPYLHEVHFGMALAQVGLGNTKAARQSLDRALEYASDKRSRRLYQAKLAVLSQGL